MTPARELEWLRFVQALRAQLAGADDDDSVLRLLLRAVRRMLGASTTFACVLDARGELAVPRYSGQAPRPQALAGLPAYLRTGEWPRPAANRLIAPVERRGRRAAALVADAEIDFAPGEGHGLVLVAGVLAERLRDLDRARASEVRARIDRKIMAELRPQDLCYQILHGLRSLTGYDHSGAVYVCDAGGTRLRLAAEQVAWSKRKSDRIGAYAEVGDSDLAALRAGTTCGFDRVRDAWVAWQGTAGPALARALDCGPPHAPAAGSMLVAPLRTGRELSGAIVLASARPGGLAAYEADLLQRLLPQASLAIRNAEMTESLKASVLRAERKHAMADLARGVAHDVNNALGSVLPVVQQISAELRDGVVDRDALVEDLARIEAALQTCRRIFSGMLSFAKSAAARGTPGGDPRRAALGAVDLLRAAASRRGVELTLEVPDGLPAVAAAQHELEQLFFNLMTNACDAMPHGGWLRVEAAPADGGATVAIRVRDTGLGMTRAELARVEEAFYTTKEGGTGLGLAICRSIVGDVGGRMRIESEPGRGTSVHVTLPVVRRAAEGGA